MGLRSLALIACLGLAAGLAWAIWPEPSTPADPASESSPPSTRVETAPGLQSESERGPSPLAETQGDPTGFEEREDEPAPPPRVTLRVRVHADVPSGSHPIERALVYLVPDGIPGYQSVLHATHAWTDEQGRAELRETGTFTLGVKAKGYALHRQRIELLGGAQEEPLRVRVELHRGHRVQGLVAAARLPSTLRGASVRVETLPGKEPAWDLPALGERARFLVVEPIEPDLHSFEVGGFEPGSYRITARVRGFAPQSMDVALPTELVLLRLMPSPRLQVELTNWPAGHEGPIRVQLVDPATGRPKGGAELAKGWGRVRLDDRLQPGPSRVLVDVPGVGRAEGRVVLFARDKDHEVRLTLEPYPDCVVEIDAALFAVGGTLSLRREGALPRSVRLEKATTPLELAPGTYEATYVGPRAFTRPLTLDVSAKTPARLVIDDGAATVVHVGPDLRGMLRIEGPDRGPAPLAVFRDGQLMFLDRTVRFAPRDQVVVRSITGASLVRAASEGQPATRWSLPEAGTYELRQDAGRTVLVPRTASATR